MPRVSAPTTAFALALAALVSAAQAAAPAGSPPAVDDLAIATASGTHHFAVEVMRTRDQLERGLMFRRQMAPDKGMLFDFGASKPVSMWMKNTYLPLDMVFIAADGRVVSVKSNAEPLSEAIIPSGGDVLGVLEINAGTAARIGVKPGDRVVDPMFAP
ncbi:DUF192 domain-containing protein [Lichenibacterium minor]|jgi:hypothetical protein|uniref:DUF192 domain-containing protein n=1 Tax=Lichenibacterium minor TaxID=2316528 RepID=A0A4V1RUZ7_9HYPH|nr:DUF192 domain-containing protein [Lichenibacterium minor]RYC32894.1 DUF192 domain-containing protein [Lichenibacterium minor]